MFLEEEKWKGGGMRKYFKFEFILSRCICYMGDFMMMVISYIIFVKNMLVIKCSIVCLNF